MVAVVVPLGVECVLEGVHVYFDLSSIIVAIVLPLGIRVRTRERFVISSFREYTCMCPCALHKHVLVVYQSIYACIVSVGFDTSLYSHID